MSWVASMMALNLTVPPTLSWLARLSCPGVQDIVRQAHNKKMKLGIPLVNAYGTWSRLKNSEGQVQRSNEPRSLRPVSPLVMNLAVRQRQRDHWRDPRSNSCNSNKPY